MLWKWDGESRNRSQTKEPEPQNRSKELVLVCLWEHLLPGLILRNISAFFICGSLFIEVFAKPFTIIISSSVMIKAHPGHFKETLFRTYHLKSWSCNLPRVNVKLGVLERALLSTDPPWIIYGLTAYWAKSLKIQSLNECLLKSILLPWGERWEIPWIWCKFIRT